jgi:hypothetical protein
VKRTVLLPLLAVAVAVLGAGGSALGQEGGDPVLVGAGDIAGCNTTGDEATANLLDGIPGTVFTTGDNAYEDGTSAEFANCYDPTWGHHKARTYPSVGNHEYYTAGASGYFGYFGAAAGDPDKGYYSYDLGSWHVVVLNSNCAAVGGCGAGSPQERWLREDLKAHRAASCTAAYFHHPRFSSGNHGNQPAVGPFWEALHDTGADVVLSGHAHSYERFAAQDPNGQADPAQGIRQFVVGTGGKSLNSFGTVQPNSEARIADTFGVLKLTLHIDGYDWEFVPVSGGTPSSDSGSGQCHDPEPDAAAPAVVGVAPAEGATGVGGKANVEAEFSERMDPSTLTASTFTLLKEGADTPVSAAVEYDWATKKAVLGPDADLDPWATYTATVEGGTEGAKDLAGNPLAAEEVWSFTTTTTAAACTITGTSKGEILTGTPGDDIICGRGGADTIKGLAGNDTLKGEGGNDKLHGGPGGDALDGGDGADTADFSGSPAPLTASLTDGSASGEGSDTLVSMENLVGSKYADGFTGSGGANTLNGGGAADALSGLGGADKLGGGGGADKLDSRDGVSGNDTLDGGSGTDTCTKDLTEKSIVSCEQ